MAVAGRKRVGRHRNRPQRCQGRRFNIEDHVIQAAYGAFRSGLERSLVIAGIGMLIAAGIAARTLGPLRERFNETAPFEL